MKISKSLILAFFLFAAGIVLAQNKNPNFIIFIADDVSWDDLGCYGNPMVQTPNIDKLAARGIRFDNVFLTASSCSPSRNSIITGRYPHNTGACELHTEPPLEMISFPEILKQNGYFTAQSGKFHMGKYAERGFDLIGTGEKVGDGGEGLWLETVQNRPKDKPFFMWFAAFDAHRVWGPNPYSGTHDAQKIIPPPYLANSEETKNDLAKFYDEIFRFDHYIGIIVEELKNQNALDNTLILIMADNGRPFPASKTRVNDRGMKTPFIAFWANGIGKKGAVCESLVSAIDIAPTLLELAGIKVPESVQGVSFSKLLKKPGKSFRNYVFAEHNWHDYEAHERMVRSKDYLYILNSRPQFTNLGPADAVGSPSHSDLVRLRETGTITAKQAEIFLAPRPVEELYHNTTDPEQFINVVNEDKHFKKRNQLNKILLEWMQETGDNIPQKITADWYEKVPGYVKTDAHGERGEMPGEKNNAAKNNNKGIF
jgi:arylsulfatase A-like enzyme